MSDMSRLQEDVINSIRSRRRLPRQETTKTPQPQPQPQPQPTLPPWSYRIASAMDHILLSKSEKILCQKLQGFSQDIDRNEVLMLISKYNISRFPVDHIQILNMTEGDERIMTDFDSRERNRAMGISEYTSKASELRLNPDQHERSAEHSPPGAWDSADEEAETSSCSSSTTRAASVAGSFDDDIHRPSTPLPDWLGEPNFEDSSEKWLQLHGFTDVEAAFDHAKAIGERDAAFIDDWLSESVAALRAVLKDPGNWECEEQPGRFGDVETLRRLRHFVLTARGKGKSRDVEGDNQVVSGGSIERFRDVLAEWEEIPIGEAASGLFIWVLGSYCELCAAVGKEFDLELVSVARIRVERAMELGWLINDGGN